MNKSDLEKILKKNKIPKQLYSLPGGLPNECYCIGKKEKWEVYYSERGLKTQLVYFNTEEAACEYFLKLIRKAAL